VLILLFGGIMVKCPICSARDGICDCLVWINSELIGFHSRRLHLFLFTER
jgi:hypothetical protein